MGATLPLLESGPGSRPWYGPGACVAGRYQIERHIADGGMGSVFEATDLLLGGKVALKTVRPDRMDAAGLQRFRREIALARRVTHPNVCRVFEVVVDVAFGSNVPFVAMELL